MTVPCSAALRRGGVLSPVLDRESVCFSVVFVVDHQSAVVANNHLADVIIPLWRRAADDVLKREACLQLLFDSEREVCQPQRRVDPVCRARYEHMPRSCVAQAAGKARAAMYACINAAKGREEPAV